MLKSLNPVSLIVLFVHVSLGMRETDDGEEALSRARLAIPFLFFFNPRYVLITQLLYVTKANHSIYLSKI